MRSVADDMAQMVSARVMKSRAMDMTVMVGERCVAVSPVMEKRK